MLGTGGGLYLVGVATPAVEIALNIVAAIGGQKRVQGVPADPKTAVGLMMSQKQYESVQSYIRKGIEEGAEFLSAARAVRKVMKPVTS